MFLRWICDGITVVDVRIWLHRHPRMHGVLRPSRRHLTFADCELAGRGGFELRTDVVGYASVWGERDRDVILLDSEALRTVCVEERTRVGMGLGGVFAVILDYVIPQ